MNDRFAVTDKGPEEGIETFPVELLRAVAWGGQTGQTSVTAEGAEIGY